MNCRDAVEALVKSLENGAPMTDEERAHIRTCERCRDLLDSAKQFQGVLAGEQTGHPSIDATVAAAEQEVRRATRRRNVLVGIAIALVVWAGVSILVMRAEEMPPDVAVMIVGAGVVIAIFVAIPFLLIFGLVRSSREGPHRLYKRLRPGRQVSGVCLGIAERTGMNVTLLRLLFVVALFFEGLGLWLYLILDLAMPVHPDDRKHLLRFKVRRWWQRRFAHAEDHAG